MNAPRGEKCVSGSRQTWGLILKSGKDPAGRGKVFVAGVVNKVEARCMLLLPPSGSGPVGKAGPLLFSPWKRPEITFYSQAKIPSEIFQNSQSYSWTRP